MKTVIEMAREAGLMGNPLVYADWYPEALERFAELVRADEHESICKFMEHGVDLAGISSEMRNYTATILKTLADCIRSRGQ